MSFADASFVIHYSRPEYDSKFVKKTLETIFGSGFVEQVREIVIAPTNGTPPYKKFYIYTVDDSHPALMRISDLINEYKFAAVVYKYEYDRKTRKYADRYWKVVYAPQLKTFTPYLMNESQMDAIVPKSIEPWAPEADAAFGPVKVCTDPKPELEMPPPMKRDNDEPKGPFKMVRSVNSPPEPEDKPNEATLSAQYWSEYWKLKKPAPLVRSTNDPSKFAQPPLCAWKDIPPPPQLFDWATREAADVYRKTYGYN